MALISKSEQAEILSKVLKKTRRYQEEASEKNDRQNAEKELQNLFFKK